VIIFGVRGRTIAGPTRQGSACPVCGRDQHATYGNLRYFHLFFVPMFPILREPVVQCLHCKKTRVGSEIPDPWRGEIKREVFTGKRTASAFAGMILIALLALFVIVVGGRGSRREALYLSNPAPGDYYVAKAADLGAAPDPAHPYTILRVEAVSGDHIDLRVGRRTYASSLRALKAIREHEPATVDYFAAKPIQLSVEALPGLRSKGTIDSVRRP